MTKKQYNDIRDEEEINRAGDHLIRAVAMDGEVRVSAVDITEAVQEAQRIHDAGPMASVALGRAMGGAVLLAQDMKNKGENLTLSIRGDGALQGLTVIVEQNLDVRASVGNPHCPLLSKPSPQGQVMDLGAAIGAGRLSVVRDNGRGDPYVGQVELRTGEIAEDITAYLLYSEQRPAAVGLAANATPQGMGRSGGFLVEPMPDASEETLAYLEARVGGFPGLDFFLEEGFTAAQIIELLMGDVDVRYLERQEVRYHCTCSRERMTRNLLTLGRKDLQELAKDPEGIQLECHFCDKTYAFSQAEVQALCDQSMGNINIIDPL